LSWVRFKKWLMSNSDWSNTVAEASFVNAFERVDRVDLGN